ncbi:Mor family transcriptional regulator [Paenibacillus castaneae]|uniref:CD3324 family protein n=1 Tax=Paenibacillus castaneae TaxID=474957 RepID=UPI000C99896D|nr:CD3324 family protein [Paenibacillus castaneae]NIK79515.1 Mor family transcriptional regulator [Paenibacillus castaneae]
MKKYVNAKDILPEHLIKEIQKHVRGKHIYIPQTERQTWGEATGIREELNERNAEIVKKYKSGFTISQLVDLYSLSEDRVRRIIYDRQK